MLTYSGGSRWRRRRSTTYGAVFVLPGTYCPVSTGEALALSNREEDKVRREQVRRSCLPGLTARRDAVCSRRGRARSARAGVSIGEERKKRRTTAFSSREGGTYIEVASARNGKGRMGFWHFVLNSSCLVFFFFFFFWITMSTFHFGLGWHLCCSVSIANLHLINQENSG